MRKVFLDTETTGLEPSDGHRIIEIGAVEMLDQDVTGREFHAYLNPGREVSSELVAMHGISNEFLADKPLFSQTADEFIDFIRGAELIIHNADFDVGFINCELSRLGSAYGRIEDHVKSVIDSLKVARRMHPGERNCMDALCKRYGISNIPDQHPGALQDSRILAAVYTSMTAGHAHVP